MEINCSYCKTLISNPKTDQTTCGKKECKRKYVNAYNKKYRDEVENKEKKNEYHKKYMKEYRKRPGVKKKYDTYMRDYRQALIVLRKNHSQEFKKIHKKIKNENI